MSLIELGRVGGGRGIECVTMVKHLLGVRVTGNPDTINLLLVSAAEPSQLILIYFPKISNL